jgi:hypothetical protein
MEVRESEETLEYWRTRAKNAELTLAAVVGEGGEVRVTDRSRLHFSAGRFAFSSWYDPATQETYISVRSRA